MAPKGCSMIPCIGNTLAANNSHHLHSSYWATYSSTSPAAQAMTAVYKHAAVTWVSVCHPATHHDDTPQGSRYGDEQGGTLVHLSGGTLHLCHILYSRSGAQPAREHVGTYRILRGGTDQQCLASMSCTHNY